jgi:hypothetical protein
MSISEMTIRCLSGDLSVHPELLVELIKDNAELNHAMHGIISGTATYEELLELVSEQV